MRFEADIPGSSREVLVTEQEVVSRKYCQERGLRTGPNEQGRTPQLPRRRALLLCMACAYWLTRPGDLSSPLLGKPPELPTGLHVQGSGFRASGLESLSGAPWVGGGGEMRQSSCELFTAFGDSRQYLGLQDAGHTLDVPVGASPGAVPWQVDISRRPSTPSLANLGKGPAEEDVVTPAEVEDFQPESKAQTSAPI